MVEQHGGAARLPLLGALMAGLLVAAGCAPAGVSAGDEAAGGAAEADPVALRGPFTRELLLTGELEAVRSISISAPQTSVFQMRIQFMAEEGSTVKKGDPLLDFDNSALADQVLDLEAQILDAEVQVVAKRNEVASELKDLEIELAQKKYEEEVARLEASIEPGIVSRKEYGDRQLAFQKAERELRETRDRLQSTKDKGQADLDVLIIQRDKLRQDLTAAQRDLDLLSIAAPAEGLVVYETRSRSTSRFQEGDSCWPGQTVMKLPDLSEMQVILFVNDVDAQLLHTGMPVRITLDSFPERELTGVVKHIPSMAVTRSDDSRLRIFKVVVSLPETWPDAMKPGMSVLGRVVVERREDVPLVARRAVRFDGEAYWLRADLSGGEPLRIHPVARNDRYYVLHEEQDGGVVQRLGLGSDDEAEVAAPQAGGR